MPVKKITARNARAKATRKTTPTAQGSDHSLSTAQRADEIVAKLKKMATKKVLDGMSRYSIPSDNAFGVAIGAIQKYAKVIGKNHELAEALWQTGHYEARIMATFLDEPDLVTSDQMDRWCNDFDSWAICDTACFKLFDQTKHAAKKSKEWAKSDREFVRRGGFALMACIALHDKSKEDPEFLPMLTLIEKYSSDDRNFVKKGMSWALRSIGERSNFLRQASLDCAKRLSEAKDASCRWIGKDALRQLGGKASQTRTNKRSS